MLLDVLLGWLPLVFASFGALWTELSGVLCICIEGFINLGCFLAFTFYVWTNSALLGITISVIVIAFISFLIAFATIKIQINPFVAGLAFNLVADGICGILAQKIFGYSGVLRLTEFTSLHNNADFSLKANAILPEWMKQYIPFIIIAIFCIVFTHFILKKTMLGRRVYAAGLFPAAALEHGINAKSYIIASWTIAGILSALAGAVILLRIGAYTPYPASGRGWLALTAVFIGFKKTWGVAFAALLFAFISVLSGLSQRNTLLPLQIMPSLPYLGSLIFYTISCLLSRLLPQKNKINKSINF
jgi:simple sugar transport system permease protein